MLEIDRAILECKLMEALASPPITDVPQRIDPELPAFLRGPLNPSLASFIETEGTERDRFFRMVCTLNKTGHRLSVAEVWNIYSHGGKEALMKLDRSLRQ